MLLRTDDGWRARRIALQCGMVLAGLTAAPQAIAQTPSCSLTYDLPADLDVIIPGGATDGDFMQFAWQHFLALNAPSVGGQIGGLG